MQRDIQLVLELWSGWAASDNSCVDYPPIAAGFKGLLPQTSKTRLTGAGKPNVTPVMTT